MNDSEELKSYKTKDYVRRANSKYRNRKYKEDEEFRKRHKESKKKNYEKNKDNKEYKEKRNKYMREYRARKKEEKLQMLNASNITNEIANLVI